jgi:RNA polymerase sigma factor (sigma-70 family)
MTATDTQRTIDAAWRIESPRLIAGQARIARDVGLAEDLAQDALVAALEQWPESGVPDNPGAWLMASAKHRAIDHLRRHKRIERKHQEIGQQLLAGQGAAGPDLDAALDDDIGDDLLRLVFTACHPALSAAARVALTLRLLGGMTTAEIARAFLVPEPTVAQRIVRAKRTLTEKQVPLEVPRGPELAERLSSVLEVVYLVFNEGYTATAGDDWVRPALCEDALRLGRVLAELMTREPEVHGLIALLEIQASRLRARVGPSGEPILLLDQNRALWDRLLIGRGLTALERAEKLGGARGPYALQAALAACHARAPTPEQTDWAQIARLYAELAHLAPSPVVEPNRAVAVGMAFGPRAGLDLVDALILEPRLQGYHFLPTVRGDLLFKPGRFDEARPEFARGVAYAQPARARTASESCSGVPGWPIAVRTPVMGVPANAVPRRGTEPTGRGLLIETAKTVRPTDPETPSRRAAGGPSSRLLPASAGGGIRRGSRRTGRRRAARRTVVAAGARRPADRGC